MGRNWEPGIPKKKASRETNREVPPKQVRNLQDATVEQFTGECSSSSLAEELEYAAGMVPAGYFKFVPEGYGKSWYVFWYWTVGTYAGHYVCAVCYRDELEKAVRILRRKMRDVEEGRKAPQKDLRENKFR